jgi:hypothetical protein
MQRPMPRAAADAERAAEHDESHREPRM